VDTALERAGWKLPDLDMAVLHEANLVLNAAIEEAWRSRGFRGEVLNAGGRFGNTTSASIPLALAMNPDRLAAGRRIGLFGYGGGLSACFAFATLRQALPAWSNAAAPAPSGASG
jgi:3-oxoacyl-[acyl-carrier-protein] synthase III